MELVTTFKKRPGGWQVEERDQDGKLRGVHMVEDKYVKEDENGQKYIDTKQMEKDFFG